MPKVNTALRTNSNTRKAQVVASGQCANTQCSVTKPLYSVVRATLVKPTPGYTLYCKKHGTRKVAIRAARAAANAAGSKPTKARSTKATKASGKARASGSKGNTQARRQALAKAALAK